jgi:hypothetical protein
LMIPRKPSAGNYHFLRQCAACHIVSPIFGLLADATLVVRQLQLILDPTMSDS